VQLPGYDTELSAVTFCIMDEDHTMGNALRYMLMKEYVRLVAWQKSVLWFYYLLSWYPRV